MESNNDKAPKVPFLTWSLITKHNVFTPLYYNTSNRVEVIAVAGGVSTDYNDGLIDHNSILKTQ